MDTCPTLSYMLEKLIFSNFVSPLMLNYTLQSAEMCFPTYKLLTMNYEWNLGGLTQAPMLNLKLFWVQIIHDESDSFFRQLRQNTIIHVVMRPQRFNFI